VFLGSASTRSIGKDCSLLLLLLIVLIMQINTENALKHIVKTTHRYR
jgi:hypothetical protein